uniref:PPIase cyclophilin-type domain-containing protein n=1 Tax=Guillardia theta TaxID=55529 RepID=A0A7S4UFH7_GUITH
MNSSILFFLVFALRVVLGFSSTPSQALRSQPLPKVAPQSFQVVLSTSVDEGRACPIVINITRSMAPQCADEFWSMVRQGQRSLQDSAFYFVRPGVFVEFGLGRFSDRADFHPMRGGTGEQKNLRGSVSFATERGNVSSSRLVINLKSNPHFDELGYLPFGKVVSGMETLDEIHQPNVGDFSVSDVAYLYNQKGISWLRAMDAEVSTIINVSAVFQGSSSFHPPVCGSSSENGLLLTLRKTLGEVEAWAGGSVAVVLLLSLLGSGVLVYVCCFLRRYQKIKRMIRYSRELEESGVEMVYEDDNTNHERERTSSVPINSAEYERRLNEPLKPDGG